MDNSANKQYQERGAQSEPFFDLLPEGVSSANFNSTPKKMENYSKDFNFGGDNVLSGFDFQPIRTSTATGTNSGSNLSAGGRIELRRGRQDSPPSYTSCEPMVRRSREPSPTYQTPVSRPQEHEKDSFDSATAAAVELTMKKYADNLLRALEGMTARLSQLESATQNLENLFEEIKKVVADTHGEADGKLRSLETHILEVHRGVQVLRDRQEIFEAHSQLAKLQKSKAESAPLQKSISVPPSIVPPAQLVNASSSVAILEAPQQQMVVEPPSISYYEPRLQFHNMPSLPEPSSPVPPPQQLQQHQQQLRQHQQQVPQQQASQQQVPQQKVPQQQVPQPQVPQQHLVQQQHLQPSVQLQQPSIPQNEVSQLHQQQPPPSSSQELLHQSQHSPAYPHHQQQQQSLVQSLPLSYSQQKQRAQLSAMASYGHPTEVPSYGQYPQGPHQGSHHDPVLPTSYSLDGPSYNASYGPSRSGLPPQQPTQVPPGPLQQPHNVEIHEPSMGRSGSGHLNRAGPYPAQGHPSSGSSHYESQGLNPGSVYSGSSYRVAQPVPSAPSGGSSGYPRLPLAPPLQHAVPAGGGGSGQPTSGAPPLSSNRVRIDEVIDKVSAMGFSKDQVRATVHRLTENNQAVDLNIVLDKLMNGDSALPPPKSWFGR